MAKHTRRDFARRSATVAAAAALRVNPLRVLAADRAPAAARDFQVGAYYFPNYHVDPRNAARYGRDWTEWELVKAARPRFAGHRQPRVPQWGYLDEADPDVMAKKIDAASSHAIDYWIFDWYWYDDGPFLNRCLEQGYFGAGNVDQVKFCCMWANHNWVELFPAHRDKPHQLLYPGHVSTATFRRIIKHVVDNYFHHPSHWRIEGCPYFSIYDVNQLIDSFGGLDQTRRRLDEFRSLTRRAGFPSLHLNAVMWGAPYRDPNGNDVAHADVVRRLGFDSVTSYVWVHHVQLPDLQTDYRYVQRKYAEYWKQAEQMYQVPYYPNVSVGWDPSPRTAAEDQYGNYGYPFTNTIIGNTPQRFRMALQQAKDHLAAQQGAPRVLNINSWNEWTEGSYLEPDTATGMAYLEAVRTVFGDAKTTAHQRPGGTFRVGPVRRPGP